LTDEVLKDRALEYHIRSWTMIPATGGVFDLVINGERLFSKKELGRHAEPGELKALVVKAIEAAGGSIVQPEGD
jgi:selenoprotein W-related protein